MRDTLSKNELAQRLRLAREQAGLSQGQVATILELHRPTVSEIEAGRRKVAADELAKFSEVYGVSLSWLTGSPDAGDDPRVELAARQLASLRREDLDVVLRVLKTLKQKDKP